MSEDAMIKYMYRQHFALSIAILGIAAILSSILQYQSAMNYLWWIVLGVVAVPSIIFSLVFAFIQIKLGQTILKTVILVSSLAIYMVVFRYIYLHLDINWNAVSEGRLQLTIFQKIVKSDWSYWLAFIFPWMISILSYKLRSKKVTA